MKFSSSMATISMDMLLLRGIPYWEFISSYTLMMSWRWIALRALVMHQDMEKLFVMLFLMLLESSSLNQYLVGSTSLYLSIRARILFLMSHLLPCWSLLGMIMQKSSKNFSAMGVVTLLSGQPKEGISVEARAESKGFYEEAVTDSSGSYRLRGLLPDTTYTIRLAKKVKFTSSRIERASPEAAAIKAGSEDIKQLDFVVFEHPEMTILSGHVEGKRIKELHSHLRVEILSATDPLRTEAVFPLPLSNFFQVKDLPRGKHLVQLQCVLPSNTHRFRSEVIEVDLERQSQIHVRPIRFEVEEDHQKQELTPAPVYPLIAGVSVIALFISIPRIKDLHQAITGLQLSGSTGTVKKDAKRPVPRKKTY